jgi:signal transduction histidine kinase
MNNPLLSGNLQEKIQWYVRAHGHSSIGGLNLMWTFFTYQQQKELADIVEKTIEEFESFDESDDPAHKIEHIKIDVNMIEKNIDYMPLETDKKVELQEMLHGIYENIDRIETIISDPGYEEKFYLEDVLDSTITELLKRYPQTLYGDLIGDKNQDESIKIHFSKRGSSRKILVCGYEMQLLMYNLISNAIEAINEMKNQNGIISILFNYKKEFVHIEVANTGKQIPRTVLKKIQSNKSVSTKGAHHGKGLQIIHDISEKYDANLAVESSEGQTVFYLDIPYND